MTTAQYEELTRVLNSDVGGVTWVLQRQPKPSATAGALAACAKEHQREAFMCLMVGMESEALELLTKADEWMSQALARALAGEGIELEYLQQFRHSVCRWLLGPPAPAHDLTRACELLRVSEEMTLANAGRYAQELNSSLPLLVYAERYTECIAKYEQCGARYPLPRGRQYREAATAYLVARERLHPTLPEPDLEQNIHTFLREEVPAFMKYGRYDQFVLWVRIATRAVAGEPARAAVRRVADQYA